MRVARPLYEALPYFYVAIGAVSIAASFAWRGDAGSTVLAVFGAVAVLGGLVLLLRRRDYRIQQRHYGGEFGPEE